MPRKPSDPYRLIQLFAPVWAEAHGGEEYFPDGRDFREAKVFLEINPEFLVSEARCESFKQRAREYMSEEFYNQPHSSPSLNHQLFHFLKTYASYAKSKIQPKPKTERQKLIACSDCGTEHDPVNLCHKCNPVISGNKETALKAIQDLSEQFKSGG